MQPKDLLKKLRKKKDGHYFVNVKGWRKALILCFSTFGYEKYLLSDYSISVPRDQQWAVVFYNDALQTVRTNKRLVHKEKLEVVKLEKKEADVNQTPQKVATESAKSKTSELDDRHAQFEQRVKQNAERLAAKHKQATAHTKREFTSFVDPLSALTEAEKHLNVDAATVEIEVGGAKMFYGVETPESKKERMSAWHLIIWTVRELDKSVYEEMNVGDVYGLYNQITTYLSQDQHAKESLNKEFEQFTYKSGELFKTFVMRYKRLRRECDEIGLVKDVDLVKSHLSRVLSTANNDDVKKTHLSVLPKVDTQNLTPFQTLDEMQLQMTVLEKHKLEYGEREGEEETSREDTSKKSRKQRKKEKKQKEQEEQARVLRTAQGADASVKGVCLYYQTGTCQRAANCTYRHTKLDDKQHELLKAFMKGKRQQEGGKAGFTCYTCGKQGHRSFECKAKASNASASKKVHLTRTSEQIVEEVGEMTKEEREKLLEQLLNKEE